MIVHEDPSGAVVVARTIREECVRSEAGFANACIDSEDYEVSRRSLCDL